MSYRRFASALSILSITFVSLTPSYAGLIGPDDAWFTLEGGDCAGVEIVTEGPGAALEIRKDNKATCVLTIGFNLTATIDDAPVRLETWGISIDGPDTLSVPLVGGLHWLGTGYNINFGSPGVAGYTIFNFGQRSTSRTGSTGLVGTFDLHVEKDGTNQTHEVFGAIGPLGTILASGETWVGSIGPNDAITGNPNTSFGELPVITIHNIPEPASATLLGGAASFGAIAIRRRRR